MVNIENIPCEGHNDALSSELVNPFDHKRNSSIDLCQNKDKSNNKKESIAT